MAEKKPDDQSGSTGRDTPADKVVQKKDTGQGTYGQTGGGRGPETQGQKQYKQSEQNGDARSKKDSNRGSSRRDAEHTDDIPKTG